MWEIRIGYTAVCQNFVWSLTFHANEWEYSMHKHRKNSGQIIGRGGITQDDLCINGITILKRKCYGDVEWIKLAHDRAMMVIKFKVPQ
jgi:hypothetical protein